MSSLFESPVRRAVLTVRAQRAIDAAVSGLTIAAAVVLPALVLSKLGWLEPDAVAQLATRLLVVPVVLALVGALRRVDRLAVAVRLDRANRLNDRYVTAWEIESLPESERNAYMRLHLAQVAAAPPRVRVWPAYPWRIPSDSPLLATVLLVGAVVALMRPPTNEFSPWTPPPPSSFHAS